MSLKVSKTDSLSDCDAAAAPVAMTPVLSIELPSLAAHSSRPATATCARLGLGDSEGDGDLEGDLRVQFNLSSSGDGIVDARLEENVVTGSSRAETLSISASRGREGREDCAAADE